MFERFVETKEEKKKCFHRDPSRLKYSTTRVRIRMLRIPPLAR